jgi:thiol:disulfide interchange protein DsbC
MTQIRSLVAAAALLAIALAASAGEAEVRRMVQGKLRAAGSSVESVQKMPWGDLYEVVVRSADGPQIFYVDGAASVIISGSAIDAKNGKNLTEERKRKLTAIKWESLPFDWAITSVRGSGRRKIAILSDPNCPYCKRFETELQKLDDITVHIFPYPVIRPESVRQSKAVWCSKDRAKAWNDLMFSRIEPQAGTDCDNPVERLVAYGRKLGATSTPTWFVETGERYLGALPLEETKKLLDEASPARK